MIREASSEFEKALMLECAKFNDVIETVYEETAPHKLCAYIYDLANAFNKFYHETKILSEEDAEKKKGYIALLKLTKEEMCIRDRCGRTCCIQRNSRRYRIPAHGRSCLLYTSVYSCVGLYPKSVGQLTEETKLRPEEVLKLLVSLELQGYIREISKNYYIKVK